LVNKSRHVNRVICVCKDVQQTIRYPENGIRNYFNKRWTSKFQL